VRAARPATLENANRAGAAIFEWIEAPYNPVRRHTSLDYHSPAEYESLHNTAAHAA